MIQATEGLNIGQR